MKENGTIVYIVDSNTMMRNGLALLVHRIKPGSRVSGFTNLKVLLKNKTDETPRLIVYEISESIEVELRKIDKLRLKFNDASILLMKDSLNQFTETQINKFNVEGYFKKNASISEIEKKISVQIEGLELPIRLSNSERRILSMIEQGYPANKIADLLKLSIYTVRITTQRMYKKIGVHNSLKAIHVARTHGLMMTAENFNI